MVAECISVLPIIRVRFVTKNFILDDHVVITVYNHILFIVIPIFNKNVPFYFYRRIDSKLLSLKVIYHYVWYNYLHFRNITFFEVSKGLRKYGSRANGIFRILFKHTINVRLRF